VPLPRFNLRHIPKLIFEATFENQAVRIWKLDAVWGPNFLYLC